MATWTVVKFSDDSIEAVPTIWLNNNKCFWPKYEANKMNKAIRNCDPVLPTWDQHDITTFRNATYDDYSVVRQKCQKAKQTSDLNSDPEKRRRRIPNRLQISSSSSSDSSNSEIETLRITRKPLNIPEMPVIKPSQIFPHLPSASTSFTENKQDQVEGSGSSTTLSNYARKNVTSNDGKSAAPCASCLHDNKVTKEFLKQILRKINMLEIITTDLKVAINNISQSAKEELVIENNIWDTLNLPVRTDDELLQLENFLKDSTANMQKSVEELAKVGDDSIDEFVRRCFKKLMTNECQMNYSWLGRKQKKIFSTLELAKLIKEAAWRNSATKKQTEKDIETSVIKCIKRAKERHDQMNRILLKQANKK